MCSASHSGSLTCQILLIFQLHIFESLEKVTKPKGSKSVKILKKETKNKEGETETEMAVLSSQNMCFGRMS